ncbi:LysM peptidoglycan-binding domain-containing protein [Rapidithrix thailandica]|uniref:LysM peptidoglycan-binding domain-containing protein n=1 Tax=Rapidithrix thailandica TaxID=413964 RepID=A0AAW9S3V5_9BACT
MKKLYLSILILIALHTWGITQSFSVPESMMFAGVKLKIHNEVRARIQRKVDDLMRNPNYYQEYVDRCNLYFPLIEKVFKEENLPDDFKYLALQESALLANAISRSNAVGYWLFKEFTAIELGMQINTQVDERKHIISASRGAAQYLKKNNYFLRNWIYSSLSYNLGLTGANNIIDRRYIGQDKAELKKDTHLYIIHLLAHKIAFQNAVNKNSSIITLCEYPANGKSIRDISQLTGISESSLLMYNRWLKHNPVPNDKKYTFLLPIPVSREAEIKSKLGLSYTGIPGGQIPRNNNTPTENLEYTIARDTIYEIVNDNPYPIIRNERKRPIAGDTITLATINGKEGFIAGKNLNILTVTNTLGVSTNKFLRTNDMTMFDELVEGQVYYLDKKDSKGPVEYHVVKSPNESPWEVAQRYGIKLNNVAKFNRMGKTEMLVMGRVLWLQSKRPKKTPVEIREVEMKMVITEDTTAIDTIPQIDEEPDIPQPGTDIITIGPNIPASDSTDASGTQYHTVQAGETLFTISRQYGVTILDLQEWNNLQNDLKVGPGQTLIVKKQTIASNNPTTGNNVPPTAKDPLDSVILIDDEGNPTSVPTDNYPDYNTPAVDNTPTQPNYNQPATDVTGGAERYHYVQRGETLFGISRKYQVSVADIKAWNGLFDNNIDIDQKLVIRKGSTSGNTNYNQPSVNPTPDYNQPATNYTPPTTVNPSATTHTVVKGETLYGIARNYQKNVKDLIAWNNLGGDLNVKVGQVLYLAPSANASTYSQATTLPTVENGYHVVRAGENLYSIAELYNITAQNLRTWNNIPQGNDVYAGQKLIVDNLLAPAGTVNTPPTYTNSGNAAVSDYHTVMKGETLFAISRKYQVNVKDLQRWNNLSGGDIKTGQSLRVKAPGSNNSSSATFTPTTITNKNNEVFHVVQKGETLYSISRKYNIKVSQIKILNQKSDNSIDIGERLRVK